MAALLKIASSRLPAIVSDVRPIAGARNIATSNGSAIQPLSAAESTSSEAPGFSFRPARPDVGDRNAQRTLPTLTSRFSATTADVAAALNTQRAAESPDGDTHKREQGAPALNGLAVRAASLYQVTSEYLSQENRPRGGSLNIKF